MSALVVLLSWCAPTSDARAQARELAPPHRPATGEPQRADDPADDEFADDALDQQEPAPIAPRVARPAEPPSFAPPPRLGTPVTIAPPIVTVDAPAPRVRLASDPPLVPPPPGPGLVPIAFEGDPARRLVVSRLIGSMSATARQGLDFATIEVRASAYELVCIAPCATWIQPGAVRFGVGASERPRWETRILQISRPSTLDLHYIDNGILRLVGTLMLLTGLGLGGGATFDLLDGGDTTPGFVTAGVGLTAFLIGLGLALAGDGMDLRARPGIVGF